MSTKANGLESPARAMVKPNSVASLENKSLKGVEREMRQTSSSKILPNTRKYNSTMRNYRRVNEFHDSSMLSLLPPRPLNTKRDIRQALFDKDQIRIYKKIAGAQTKLDNTHKMNVPQEMTRKAKFIQTDLGKFVTV